MAKVIQVKPGKIRKKKCDVCKRNLASKKIVYDYAGFQLHLCDKDYSDTKEAVRGSY